MGREFAHRADDAAAREGRVARDQDLAHFHFGAFIDVEAELYRVRARDSFIGRLHHGELPAGVRPAIPSGRLRLS